jgi:hypothetical protein
MAAEKIRIFTARGITTNRRTPGRAISRMPWSRYPAPERGLVAIGITDVRSLE